MTKKFFVVSRTGRDALNGEGLVELQLLESNGKALEQSLESGPDSIVKSER